MARHRKRDPILPQNRLDRWRRRLERADLRRRDAPAEGPFLRRMWQRRRIGIGPLIGVLLVGWAAYALIAGEHGAIAIASLEADRDQLRAEIEAVEAQLEAVRERLSEASDDAYLLEKTARETYGLARPGEIVYTFDAEALGVEPARRGEPLAAPLARPGAGGAP